MSQFTDDSHVLRALSAEEQADLPDTGWENFTEDPTAYKVSYWQAYEVREGLYEKAKEDGMLCMKYEGRFYIAI